MSISEQVRRPIGLDEDRLKALRAECESMEIQERGSIRLGVQTVLNMLDYIANLQKSSERHLPQGMGL